MYFENQVPRVRRKGGEACCKSSVKLPHSVIIWGAISSAGVGGGLSTVLSIHKSKHPSTRRL